MVGILAPPFQDGNWISPWKFGQESTPSSHLGVAPPDGLFLGHWRGAELIDPSALGWDRTSSGKTISWPYLLFFLALSILFVFLVFFSCFLKMIYYGKRVRKQTIISRILLCLSSSFNNYWLPASLILSKPPPISPPLGYFERNTRPHIISFIHSEKKKDFLTIITISSSYLKTISNNYLILSNYSVCSNIQRYLNIQLSHIFPLIFLF